MTRDALAHLANVRIERYTGLTVEFARQQRASVIVRGLRVLSDFEWEFQLALTNRNLAPDIDTICLMASQEYSFLSSSVVKEIALAGGNVTEMVPPHVFEGLRAKLRELGRDSGNIVNLVSLRD
jgi:pantetheine-phosphate adenylyltransferase